MSASVSPRLVFALLLGACGSEAAVPAESAATAKAVEAAESVPAASTDAAAVAPSAALDPTTSELETPVAESTGVDAAPADTDARGSSELEALPPFLDEADPIEGVCREAPGAPAAALDEVSDPEWLDLIVPDIRLRRDCTGRPLELEELPLRCAVVARPGTPADVVPHPADAELTPLDQGFALWSIPVERFSNGDRTLLVALVQASEPRLAVHAIGAVRLPPYQVELGLTFFEGERLLFASGESCPLGEAGPNCERILQVMLIHGERIVPLELRDQANECHGPTTITLSKTREVKRDSGWLRRFQLTASTDLVDDQLVVSEQLVASDRPSEGDENGGRVLRSSDLRRVLRFSGAYFVYDRKSLWDAVPRGRSPSRPAE